MDFLMSAETNPTTNLDDFLRFPMSLLCIQHPLLICSNARVNSVAP